VKNSGKNDQLKRLRDGWPQPCSEVMFAEYVAALEGQTVEVVKKAVDSLFDACKLRPSVADVRLAVRVILSDIHRQEREAGKEKPLTWDEIEKNTPQTLGKLRWQLIRALWDHGEEHALCKNITTRMDSQFSGAGSEMVKWWLDGKASLPSTRTRMNQDAKSRAPLVDCIGWQD